VIADLSSHHVEGFVLAEGHTVQQFDQDYGYDLLLTTYDERGYIEPGQVAIQLKAAESLRAVESDYVFDVDIRDYNLWISEKIPVILILYDASRRRGYWVAVNRYFQDNPERRPGRGARWARVRIPRRQAVNRRAIATMRELKRNSPLRLVVEP
jgi:hypothetical protein